MPKNAGLRLRVEDELRKQFITACRAQDQTASQVLRAFMRSYVRRAKVAQPVLRASMKGLV